MNEKHSLLKVYMGLGVVLPRIKINEVHVIFGEGFWDGEDVTQARRFH